MAKVNYLALLLCLVLLSKVAGIIHMSFYLRNIIPCLAIKPIHMVLLILTGCSKIDVVALDLTNVLVTMIDASSSKQLMCIVHS